MTRDADAYEQMVKDANYQRPPITPASDKAADFARLARHFGVGRKSFDDNSGHCPDCLYHCEGEWGWCPKCGHGFDGHKGIKWVDAERMELKNEVATLTRRLALAEALADAVEDDVFEDASPEVRNALAAFRGGEK